jgi:DNA-directed RNA polymerase subunit alpha
MDKKEFRALTIPKVKWEKKAFTSTFGELVAQPLEPGFGTTIGNALRRILLGAIEGAATTSVIIKGANNEFSSINGVVEDVMQIVLNIKGVVVRNVTGKPGKMHLRVKGEHVAKVSDITADSHLELVNLDHVIAHVSAGAELDIEFFVETGRGYVPASWPHDKPYQDDNRIFIDAMFSPVRRVTFDVEKTRVGEHIDYDKLAVQVTTDGSELPTNVMHYAVSVLRTQLEHFLLDPEINFNALQTTSQQEEVVEQKTHAHDGGGLKGLDPELLASSIDQLELSVRARNCLLNAGIKTILDLVNLYEADILKIKNFGKKTLDEVRDAMKSLNLSFEMNIKEEELQKALAQPKQEE